MTFRQVQIRLLNRYTITHQVAAEKREGLSQGPHPWTRMQVNVLRQPSTTKFTTILGELAPRAKYVSINTAK
jgi:hypothetical protein